MRVYPAIVPPPEISSKITDFSNRLAASYLNVSAQRASGPHITLRAPQYPGTIGNWLQAATDAVEDIKPFSVAFGNPTFLARGVLVLATSATELHKLNQRLATGLSGFNHPTITYFDYDLYTPHLTLAYAPHAPQEIRVKLHQQVVSELLPLPDFEVDHVAIFTRDDHDYQYRLSDQLPLTP